MEFVDLDLLTADEPGDHLVDNPLLVGRPISVLGVVDLEAFGAFSVAVVQCPQFPYVLDVVQ